MRAGISTASLFMRKDNEEALPLLDSLGVKTAEAFLTSFSEYEPAFAELLASRKGNVDIHSVHVLTSQIEPQFLSKHHRVKEDAYEILKKILESANILGAKRYTFHGITRMRKGARSGEKDNFTDMITAFDELIRFCESYGVELCLENVEWSTYNRIGVFTKLSEALPSLKGVLDIKQARISEVPYENYLEEMGEKLAYVHLSDINAKGEMCLPGKGFFDFKTLIKRLKDIGFDGNLYIEVYAQNYDEYSELKSSMDYLNELLYRYNALT